MLNDFLENGVISLPKWVVFLYRGFPERVNQLRENQLNGIYIHLGAPLVGLDTELFNLTKRSELMRTYSLHEFEVEQEKFDYIITQLPLLGARITAVDIYKSDSDAELKEEITLAVNDQDTQKICEVIHEYRTRGNDVEAVEFYWKNSRIRFTRLAELNVSASKIIVPEILNTFPVGYLAGVVRGDGEIS